MTVIQIIDLSRDLLNEQLASGRTFPDDSSSFFADTTLLGYLNREQQVLQNHIIQSYENFFVTSVNINISANVDEYTMNSSVVKILRMEWIDPDPLVPIEIQPISFNDKENYIGYSTQISATAEVKAYAIKGNSVVLRPIPRITKSNAIRYHFVKKLPELTSATDVSEIPETWHEAISWGIYKRALIQQEGNAESIQFATVEYEKFIANIKQWAEDRQVQRPRYVKRRK